jgi:hypothetical protein
LNGLSFSLVRTKEEMMVMSKENGGISGEKKADFVRGTRGIIRVRH